MISEAREGEPNGAAVCVEPVERPAVDRPPTTTRARPECPRLVGDADDVEEEIVEGVAEPPLNGEGKGFFSPCAPAIIAEVSIIIIPEKGPEEVEFVQPMWLAAREEAFFDPGHGDLKVRCRA